MKRSYSEDDLDKLENKKRKCSLTIQPVKFLKCDICYEDVKLYGQCISSFVYCSESCLHVLCLRQLNNNERNSFNDEMEIEN